jgi:type IX secretion system PorP/SprF family membrane protein
MKKQTTMRKKLNYCLMYGSISILLAICLPALAQQDNHLSQFNASPLTFNPAMTGMFKGNYRGQLNYRTQWGSILNKPFINQVASFDMPRKKFGYGIIVMSNKAGSGNMNTTSALLSCAYEVTSDPTEVHHLTTGLQVGFINKSVDVSRLTFDNQYTTANGGGFDQTVSSQENFQSTSYLLPDVNFGIYYYNTNKEKKFNPYIGASGFHMTIPKESFYGNLNRMPIRYLIHGGSKIKINEVIKVDPSFLYMQQNNVHEINFGVTGDYYMLEQNTHLQLGTFYRYKDAFIIQTAVLYKEYTLRMSYDFNTSSLNAYTHGRGGFEISIIYTRENVNYVPSF